MQLSGRLGKKVSLTNYNKSALVTTQFKQNQCLSDCVEQLSRHSTKQHTLCNLHNTYHLLNWLIN